MDLDLYYLGNSNFALQFYVQLQLSHFFVLFILFILLPFSFCFSFCFFFFFLFFFQLFLDWNSLARPSSSHRIHFRFPFFLLLPLPDLTSSDTRRLVTILEHPLSGVSYIPYMYIRIETKVVQHQSSRLQFFLLVVLPQFGQSYSLVPWYHLIL
ncbi:hypothetical protein TWF102_001613 [Orbilia oligospora]|uniref:Uncharacterized protein n=1 Tax=Orbilia oligospora TaxID=2813651 RepID=A0A7C8N2D9_ORBOL|nr:hypothetical protein TWF102_001613 [Orbilia oligospora]KAF3112385.1 hypothetical protein TWF103_003171 [Orbilia oligospora]KAF3123100.1 hypothetical protein TWF594_002512 [Orbilia oligospora]